VVCRKNVNTLVLYYDDAHTGEQVVGKWHSSTPVTRQSTVALQDPTAGWQESPRLGTLVDGIRYHLGGGSGDNQSATEDVSFDLAALAKLSPGQILFQQGDAPRQVADIASMRSQACR
jgi:hypothetical protein